MIMPYHRRTNTLKDFLSFKNVITIFFVLMIILIGKINPLLIGGPLQSIALLAAGVKNNIEESISGAFSLIRGKEKLNEENRNLNNQYKILSDFCALSIQSLKSNRDELEKTLGRRGGIEKDYVATGYVIGKPPISPYGTIIIDLGSKSGVKTGNRAIVGGYIIGVVSEILNDRLIIKLYGEKGVVTAILVGEKRLALRGEGMGLGAIKTKIANETKISIGEDARLAEAPNYLFGVVSGTKQSSVDQYQDLIIKSPVNIFELSSVDIVSE